MVNEEKNYDNLIQEYSEQEMRQEEIIKGEEYYERHRNEFSNDANELGGVRNISDEEYYNNLAEEYSEKENQQEEVMMAEEYYMNHRNDFDGNSVSLSRLNPLPRRNKALVREDFDGGSMVIMSSNEFMEGLGE